MLKNGFDRIFMLWWRFSISDATVGYVNHNKNTKINGN